MWWMASSSIHVSSFNCSRKSAPGALRSGERFTILFGLLLLCFLENELLHCFYAVFEELWVGNMIGEY